ncbi:hypothetical protein CRG98_045362 [Punica granatum]|uniref:J domain-containing protein n=1 Tax=Punica granatum TaxID=22663 RepID=A0A2I0HRQ1_PUNGR|nr:hypothetical protein CRG98_045362 [Punica granatum]
MPATCLFLHAPTPSTLPTRISSYRTKSNLLAGSTAPRKLFVRCKASTSSSSITDFDLYELLGLDSSSTQSQIKLAYRSLQKRCHPDIAGPTGHDMSIILNEAYALLSDPNSRLAYDKARYTGRPLYSVWLGSESEQRAVFVDEVKCVGCLKCALFAGKTFAIESVYGRARVVAQWADPEHKIQEAIGSCPVDCISLVERSDLAALEFLMSKQLRGNVRVGTSNAVGSRVSNIFVEVKKFQSRVKDVAEKSATQNTETDLQREARFSAIHAIRSLSNWLQWRAPTSSGPQELTRSTRKLDDPNIRKLRDAAAARKKVHQIKSNHSFHDEYWIPSNHALPPATKEIPTPKATSRLSNTKEREKGRNDADYSPGKVSPIRLAIPFCTSAIAVAIVKLYSGGGKIGRLEDHIGGSLALEIVNSSWLQVILAGFTWFLIGMAIVELIAAVGNDKE